MNYILGENGEGGPSPEVYLDPGAAQEMDAITDAMRTAAAADLGEGASESEIEARTATLMSTRPMVQKFLDIIVGAAHKGAIDKPVTPAMQDRIQRTIPNPASA